MSQSRRRRIQKLRRLEKARLRTGKTIVVHKLQSGRTGAVGAKRRASLPHAGVKTP